MSRKLLCRAKKLENIENIDTEKSTITEFEGSFYKLFGTTYVEGLEFPNEYPILVEFIRKSTNTDINSIILRIVKDR